MKSGSMIVSEISSINWWDFLWRNATFYSFRVMLFLYKLIDTSKPKYLSFIVNTGLSARTRQLKIPRNTSHYTKALMVRGVAERNTIDFALNVMDFLLAKS